MNQIILSFCRVRYIEIGNKPIAVICVKNKVIKWYIINEHFPYKFIRNKNNVSDLSYCFDYFENKKIPEDGEHILVTAWFSKDYNLKNKSARLFEIVIPYPSYNSALVILKES